MSIDKIFKLIKELCNPPIRFTDGSYVDWLNREAIVYVDGPRRVPIDFMFDVKSKNASARTLRASDIEYWEEHGRHTRVSETECGHIIQKIQEYCERKKIPLNVIA